MKGFDYEYILRPNFEAWAFINWLAAGLGVYLLYRTQDLPVIVFQVMGFVCVGMTLGRGIAAVARYLKNRRMKSGSLKEFISWREIYSRISRNGKQVWLGTGFPWTQEEVQKATDCMNRADAGFFHNSAGRWIHGLDPRPRRFLLWRKNKNIELPIKVLEGHTLVVGSTGTGKTRFFDLMVSQAIFRNEMVIVIDPKGDPDLREKMKLACERVGAGDRFMFFHPALSGRSVRIDPLKNWNRSTELASRVAALIPSETESDPFKNFCWQAMDWINQGLLYLDRQPNLLKLNRYINEGVEDLLWEALRKYFALNRPEIQVDKKMGDKKRLNDVIYKYKEHSKKMLEMGERNPAIDGLITSHQHNQEHFQKMVVSLVPVLSMLTSGNLSYLLSPEPGDGDPRPALDLATLIEQNAVLYVGLDNLSDASVGSAIGSVLLADLTAAAGAIYNRAQCGGAIAPINVFVDEAAEAINDPCIQVLNKGRGAGFRVVIATQTLADLEVRTGSKAGARQVIANANNWVIFRVIDDETQKYIAQALPKTSVRSVDMGYRSASASDSPVKFSGTYTESLKETATELVPPALLGMLPDFHYFCRIGSQGATWKGKVPILEY